MKTAVRCAWAESTNPRYPIYHDEEWGVPVHDDRKLFEFLILEGAQAGLSWSTILNKRDGYRAAFHDFEPAAVARMNSSDITRLMNNPGIVRNRLKITAAIDNAKVAVHLQRAFGSLDAYLWQFVDGVPIQNAFKAMANVPASSPVSDTMSKDLKARGMRFVGTTICYAFMQAVGMVNDHTTDCFRWKLLQDN
jgi:DNA-3-methyladenine glycosylase I